MVGYYANLLIASREVVILKEKNEERLFFSVKSKHKTNEQIPIQAVTKFIFESIFGIIHLTFFSDTKLFPIERVALTKSAFYSVEIKKNLGIGYPNAKFMSMMFSYSRPSLNERNKEVEDYPKIMEYINLANFLEDKILQGKTSYEDSGFYEELLFVTNNITLEIDVTSSMIKELVSLVIYLRYFAKPNELIIIDEPEMNLHPAAQIEIIEFLAMLVNAGLNVMITTHSPYIVGHISNLIEATKHHNPEEIKDYFYVEDARAFITQNKVSMYLFEGNTAKNILETDGNINWETFWNVSSDVSGIYAQLLKNKQKD